MQRTAYYLIKVCAHVGAAVLSVYRCVHNSCERVVQSEMHFSAIPSFSFSFFDIKPCEHHQG